jgi:dihydroflavonol-4-reductase
MILVTGGTGLLGSHLLFQLTQSDNVPINAIYRNESRITQVKKLFEFYGGDNAQAQFLKINWIKSDILDIPSLDEAMIGVETVYHCAALVSFDRKDFDQLMKVNREGTFNVVNACLSAEVKTLCHVSSTAAIGGVADSITSETTKWKISPRTSGYSISKYSAEKEVWRGVEEGLPCVIVNPSVIFGAGDWNESSMAIFKTAKKGMKFYTPGQNGFVDARDVAECMIRLVQSEQRNERYLCVGFNLPFADVFGMIAEKFNKPRPSIQTPRWLAEIAWRISVLSAKITGRKPVLTKESVRNAYAFMTYDNSKLTNALNFTFRTAEDTIQNAIDGRLDGTN